MLLCSIWPPPALQPSRTTTHNQAPVRPISTLISAAFDPPAHSHFIPTWGKSQRCHPTGTSRHGTELRLPAPAMHTTDSSKASRNQSPHSRTPISQQNLSNFFLKLFLFQVIPKRVWQAEHALYLNVTATGHVQSLNREHPAVLLVTDELRPRSPSCKAASSCGNRCNLNCSQQPRKSHQAFLQQCCSRTVPLCYRPCFAVCLGPLQIQI